MPENLFSVILYSYRRPEMTKKAIERLLTWPKLKRLYVSIDGEREFCSDEEKSWRKEVIKFAEIAAQANSKVTPVIWEVNRGTTDHAIRIMGKVLESVDFFIAVEEDNLILNPGLDFLADGLSSAHGPFISTAYSSSYHEAPHPLSRYTFFPEQWTTALNREIFEAFEKVWEDKNIDSKVVIRNFSPLFKTNPLYLRVVSEKWLSIFRHSASVPNYGDALMTYAALSVDTPYFVPLNSLVSDLGSLDERGMNPRGTLEISQEHTFTPLEVENLEFCRTCEYKTNGIRGMGIVQTAKALSRRHFKTIKSTDPR